MKNNLKDRREDGGWLQKEFAEKMGISVSHLSMLESGKRIPSLKLALKIANVFDLHIEGIWTK
jgi:putative transcriptional regulator